MKTHLNFFASARAARHAGFVSRVTLAAAIACTCFAASADGFGRDDPLSGDSHREIRALALRLAGNAKRDPLAIDPAVAIKEEPVKSVDLPGVMKLEGADRGLLDPTRERRISWRNGGSQTVYVSATQPNRIQLPFVNPKVIANSDVQIDKRATGSNVYVAFKNANPTPVQIWIEPPDESSASVGLQLVPKTMPAQSIIVVDDTVAGSAGRAQRSSASNEYLTRVQAILEEAALGASPTGYSVVELQVPAIVLNGLLVEGVRRLSSRSDDIYVYTASNPGSGDVHLRESEFDGPDVKAVSILPKPYLHAGERAIVVVLAKKREGS